MEVLLSFETLLMKWEGKMIQKIKYDKLNQQMARRLLSSGLWKYKVSYSADVEVRNPFVIKASRSRALGGSDPF